MSEFQKDELSLEETNKLRIKLGLKPLAPDSDDERDADPSKGRRRVDDDDGGDPLANQEEKAARNYAAHQESQRRKREEEKTRERIAKAQNRRELNRKLQGRTLGDSESSTAATTTTGGEGSLDAKKWLKAQRKKAKENEARLQREEEEAAAAAATDAARTKYDAEDLRGLKVAHDADEFDLEEGGEARILTLRDTKILDQEDDELMDSALDQAERDRILAERKKGVKEYSGLDDEEFEAGNVGKGRGVLSKYDGDIEKDGIVRDSDAGFRLGGSIKSRGEQSDEKRRDAERAVNRTLLSLDYSKNEEMSDYLKEGDVGFKKPKTKKKKRVTERIRLDDDDDDDNRATEGATRNNGATESASSDCRTVNDKADLVDDDDLATSLAIARRRQAKKAFQKTTPEMIARNLAAQRAAEEEEERAAQAASSGPGIDGDLEMAVDGVPSTNAEQQSGLTFDETSEFVRNIASARDASTARSSNEHSMQNGAAIKVKKESVEAPSQRTAHVDAVTSNGVDADDLLRQDPVKQEEESDEEMLDIAPDDAGSNIPPTDGDAKADEPLISSGLASTLSILRSQGQLTGVSAEEQDRERKQREYDAWLAKRRVEDKMREAQLAASKAQGSAKDQATREYENRMREMEESRMAQERFKEYKPDIDIKYHDEFGRTLDHHEAWKRLSHVFHAKMPGKKKQEKRLQKIENERQREKMLAGDTPTGMTKAFAERAERSGQAYMVLGVGARNNAPQDAGMLGPNTVSRGGSDKGKARQRASAADYGDGGVEGIDGSSGGGGAMSTMSATDSPGGAHRSGLESDVTGITSFVPRSTVAKSKAGFAPIKRTGMASAEASVAAVQGSSSASSPGRDMAAPPPGKFKLAFGAPKRPAPASLDGKQGASSFSLPAKQAKRE